MTKLSKDITLIQIAIVAQPVHQIVHTGSKLKTRLEQLYVVGPNHRPMQKVEAEVKRHQFKVRSGIAAWWEETRGGEIPNIEPDQNYLEEV